jgi:DNA-directed RNA polymerase subunit F
MPQITLANYIALREAVELLEHMGHEGSLLDQARDALHALRKFFPPFDLWEREQAARMTP